MPAALEVDHEQVKALAFQIGIRDAARQMGLPEQTVLKWATREKWTEQFEQVKQAKLLKIEKQGMSSVVSRSPLEIIASLGGKTKLVQAKTVYKTAKAFQRKDSEQLIHLTKAVKENVDTADTLFGYTQGQPALTQVNINLTGVKLPTRE
jgi:hypothetical protein